MPSDRTSVQLSLGRIFPPVSTCISNTTFISGNCLFNTRADSPLLSSTSIFGLASSMTPGMPKSRLSALLEMPRAPFEPLLAKICSLSPPQVHPVLCTFPGPKPLGPKERTSSSADNTSTSTLLLLYLPTYPSTPLPTTFHCSPLPMATNSERCLVQNFLPAATRCGTPWASLQSPATASESVELLSCLSEESPPDIVKSLGRWTSDSLLRYWRSLEDIATRHIAISSSAPASVGVAGLPGGCASSSAPSSPRVGRIRLRLPAHPRLGLRPPTNSRVRSHSNSHPHHGPELH